MKHPLNCSLLVSALFLGASGSIEAQSYAPNTDYHDPVQRVFVVEAARVLAWWSDPGATNLAAVADTVTTKADQSTVWEIRWLDAGGKTAKKATISYSADLPKAGPDFYRSVFEQLWRAGCRNPPSLDAIETTEGFWRGAARMGLSREASLHAAFELVRDKSKHPEREWIPELAGLLTHAALPGYASRVTLDRVVLARGAAWLAFVESLTKTKLDPLWAPVLFQAGRERAAAQAWQASQVSKLEKPTPQQKGWNLWMRKPPSREVFLFATDPTNLPMAMPMLTYDTMVNGTGDSLAELIEQLVGSPERLPALHNYAPLFATGTSIGGGHILNGAWAVYSRLAWMGLLSSYAPAPNDYQGFAKVLNEVNKTTQKKLAPEPDRDGSLIGFRESVPLLRLAHTEGAGDLIPTPVATARDLLNYGWEMTGWQMGARYRFVNSRWGVHELGEPIYKTVTTELDGLMPFFKRSADANLVGYAASLKRLQAVEGLFQLVGFSPAPEDAAGELEAGHLFVKRCWLRPRDLEWQMRALWNGGVREIPELIRASQAEGGNLAAVSALAYLSSLNSEALRQIPQGEELTYAVAESLSQPTYLKMRVVFEKKFKGLDSFKQGQELERIYWQNPDAGLEPRVIIYYIESGAYKSALRFYSQARSNFLDPVKFSNGLGLQLFVLGYCQNDAKLREWALADSASGSYMDMLMHIWEAAIRDQPKEIEKYANEIVDRYEQQQGVNSTGRRLLAFLPLLPALRDPNNPSRRQALEDFGKEAGWTILRFIWIEKFKMSTADAIVFLGGRENNLLHQFLMAYLEKDLPPAAIKSLNTSDARREQKVLGWCLYHRLHPVSPPFEDTDLKPAGATSIRQAVLQNLEASGRPK